MKTPSFRWERPPPYVAIHNDESSPEASPQISLSLSCLGFVSSKTVKRTPSKRANPLRVPTHRYPSRVWQETEDVVLGQAGALRPEVRQVLTHGLGGIKGGCGEGGDGPEGTDHCTRERPRDGSAGRSTEHDSSPAGRARRGIEADGCASPPLGEAVSL